MMHLILAALGTTWTSIHIIVVPEMPQQSLGLLYGYVALIIKSLPFAGPQRKAPLK